VLGLDQFWSMLLAGGVLAAAVRFVPVLPERVRIALSIAVVLAFLVWMPFVVGSYRTSQLTTVAAWSIVAIGLNILTGYNGQISLGHGAFVIIGAYTAAILTDGHGQLGFLDSTPWPFWAAMIMAGLVAAAAGVAVGVPSLRLSGPYLAVATLSLVIAMPPVFEKYKDVTGGRSGLRVPQPPPPDFLKGILDRHEWFFFLALVTVILMALLALLIVRSRWGRAFVAIRDSEVAATAVGISAPRYKVLAFTISAFYAGVAGSIFVFAITGFMSPQSITIALSINYFTAIVIGGLGSIMGAIIGGFIVVLLPDLATSLGTVFFGERKGEQLWPTIYGAILILVIIVMPYGVSGFLHRLGRLRAQQLISGIRSTPATVSSNVTGLAERLFWRWNMRAGKDKG
jgi:branched-chain amino acid transport system permease protein